MPDNFTPEASVKAINEAEVSVEFAFSGELPADTEVTIEIPSENIIYEEGTTLYFYYCIPENDSREFVSQGKYQGDKVTFPINHCSEYVITTIGPGEVAQTGSRTSIWPFAVGAIIVITGAGFFIVFSRKKL